MEADYVSLPTSKPFQGYISKRFTETFFRKTKALDLRYALCLAPATPNIAIKPMMLVVPRTSTTFQCVKPSVARFSLVATLVRRSKSSCLFPCKYRDTNCGSCHPSEFHGTRNMKCVEKCNKTHPNCDHPCEKSCGQPCGTCEYEMGSMTLECGHTVAATCANNSWEKMPICKKETTELELDCGHKFSVKCHLKDEKLVCTKDCIFELPCGHKCGAKCAECPESGHTSCTSKCGKALDCGHKCNAG